MGSTLAFILFSHGCDTLIIWLALLSSDLTSVTSITSPYTLTRFTSILSCLHSSIEKIVYYVMTGRESGVATPRVHRSLLPLL